MIGDKMLDQIRRDLQRCLDDVLAEVDKLRRALAALGPGNGNSDSSLASSSRREATAAPKFGRSTGRGQFRER